MNLIYDIVKEKELIPRKKVTSIIEKILRYLGYDFLHDRYKEIVYLESTPITSEEHYIKSLYDGFMYLLTNYKTTITNTLLKKFLYIITNEIYDDYVLSKIATRYFEINELSGIEKAVKMNILVYKEFGDMKDKLLISYMVLSFILVKHNIPCIQITRKRIADYDELLISGDENKLYSFIYKMITEAKYMDKTYYSNLTPLTYDDIYLIIKQEQKCLVEKYKIVKVILYGSYVKGINRFDSDIDLLVEMQDDLTYAQRREYLTLAKTYLTEKFNRFVDIEEMTQLMSDNALIEFSKYKKVY